MLLVHIAAGSVGLVAGYIALFATKGMSLHRRAGMVFVAAMLTMTAFGFVLAILHGTWAVINVSAAIVTAYLAVTALTVILTMLYWVWRIRLRRRPRSLAGGGAPEPGTLSTPSASAGGPF